MLMRIGGPASFSVLGGVTATGTHSEFGVWISRPGCPGLWKSSVILP